jgi:hypothetical protein
VGKLKAASIEWLDSSSLDGSSWKDIDEVRKLELSTAYACGFVIAETKEHITIASHMHQHEVAGEIAIPKIAIKKIKRFTVKTDA